MLPDATLELGVIRQDLRYRLVRRIAQGGMGSVYEARQSGADGFEKTVAVKTIVADLEHEDEWRGRFVGEAKLVAELVHENIVQVYHLGLTRGVYFIAMEFVDGVDLEAFIRWHREAGSRVPVEIGAFIVSRICRGLDYAHRRSGADGTPYRLVHRDICPKNVLVNFEGVVKVTDFGIAKARRLMEQDDEIVMGKFEYMSPEQSRGEPTDARSDLFSLGALGWEILAGERAFAGDSPSAVLESVRTYDPPRLATIRPDVPEELSSIVHRALSRDPSSRWPDAGSMGLALETYMYRDRFGPTNVTLGEYVRGRFGLDSGSGGVRGG